jgi:hypothetical protein
MPRVGFQSTIPVFEREKTFRVSDHAVTVNGNSEIRQWDMATYLTVVLCGEHTVTDEAANFKFWILKDKPTYSRVHIFQNLIFIRIFWSCSETYFFTFLVVWPKVIIVT